MESVGKNVEIRANECGTVPCGMDSWSLKRLAQRDGRFEESRPGAYRGGRGSVRAYAAYGLESDLFGLHEMLISVSWRRVPAAADHRLVGFQFV